LVPNGTNEFTGSSHQLEFVLGCREVGFFSLVGFALTEILRGATLLSECFECVPPVKKKTETKRKVDRAPKIVEIVLLLYHFADKNIRRDRNEKNIDTSQSCIFPSRSSVFGRITTVLTVFDTSTRVRFFFGFFPVFSFRPSLSQACRFSRVVALSHPPTP